MLRAVSSESESVWMGSGHMLKNYWAKTRGVLGRLNQSDRPLVWKKLENSVDTTRRSEMMVRREYFEDVQIFASQQPFDKLA